jgi:hypothetical protein
MHSAIIAIVVPEMAHDATFNQKWQVFIADVNHVRQATPNPLHKQKGVLRLAENVWQVNFHENPSALARLVSCAVEHKLTYGILQLDGAPQWLPAGFDPKTI